MKTIWETKDRQGVKYFRSCPEYLEGFDIFSGVKIFNLPKNRKSYRLIRNFKVEVRCSFATDQGKCPVRNGWICE